MADENPKPAGMSHLRRITYIWLVLSVVADLVFWFALGPHMAPGRMTSTAQSDQFDFNFLMIIALPVMIAVWTFLGYSIRTWNAKKKGVPEPVGGEAARGNRTVQVAWISITTVIVLFLAGFGTVALIVTHGSGGGEGPSPLWAPSGASAAETAALTKNDSWSPNHVLVVQVVAQQWKFTYRYPQFGGFETPQLVLPNDTNIAFNVTSLDVIHSFWAYQLGVKADANPMENNVAFTETEQTGKFVVRCSELCGLWHGAMFDYGHVVSASAFTSWATSTEAANAKNTKFLAPFAWTYVPDANGAAGGYYIDANVTPYSKSELYGAKPGS
ncbi:MAG: cytochrome c oxidase subunit II [Acidimicrobiales bacterium]|jgi:cytochrome c oxidase subunit 2